METPVGLGAEAVTQALWGEGIALVLAQSGRPFRSVPKKGFPMGIPKKLKSTPNNLGFKKRPEFRENQMFLILIQATFSYRKDQQSLRALSV